MRITSTTFTICHRGFSLLEVVVVTGIVSMMTVSAISVMTPYRSQKIVDANVESVLSVFAQAHFDTISARSDSVWVVHIAHDQVTSFRGSTYATSSVGNVVIPISPLLEINQILLEGGGVDVHFNALTGSTAEFGSFVIQSKGNALSRTITINQTGAISL